MAKTVDKFVLSNGLVVLGEQMAGVGSVAFGFLLPAGALVMLSGLMARGASLCLELVRIYTRGPAADFLTGFWKKKEKIQFQHQHLTCRNRLIL